MAGSWQMTTRMERAGWPWVGGLRRGRAMTRHDTSLLDRFGADLALRRKARPHGRMRVTAAAIAMAEAGLGDRCRPVRRRRGAAASFIRRRAGSSRSSSSSGLRSSALRNCAPRATILRLAGGQVVQAGLRPNPILTASQELGGTIILDGRASSGRSICSGVPRGSTLRERARDMAALSVRGIAQRLLAAAVREQAGRLLAARRIARGDQRGARGGTPHARPPRSAGHRGRRAETRGEPRRGGSAADRSRRRTGCG